MGRWLYQNQEKFGGVGLCARRNNRQPGTAALPNYGRLKNFSGQLLMGLRPTRKA